MLKLTAADIRCYIEAVEHIPFGWDGDLLSLSDVQKDAAVRYVAATIDGLIDECMPGENASKYLFGLLHHDPAAFVCEFKRFHSDNYTRAELVELLECEATMGQGEKLYRLLQTDPLEFAGAIGDGIYAYLEADVRDCLLDAYGEKDQPDYPEPGYRFERARAW